MKTDKLLLERIKKDIKKAEVVSFDIFDTLLVRPYVQPTDLFVHMEKAYDCAGFAAERRDAERRTRIRHRELEDITLDMIYDEIDDEFKDMKAKERDWEEMVLRANPELKQVYDYVKAQGKKIAITSDMYLPAEFLAKVLRREGFDGWDKLYVSGDLGKTKGHKTIWPLLEKDFSVDKLNKILHIGDNPRGDFEAPKATGLSTVLYQRPMGQYSERDKRVINFRKQTNGNLGASVLLGMLCFRWLQNRCNKINQENYWSWLGYNYGGPLHFAYAKFVEQDALKNDINHILFVAREGYILQKVFNKINPNIKTSYVYAQRALNLICNLDYNPNDFNFVSYLCFYCAEKNVEIREAMAKVPLSTASDYHHFILDNMKLFEAYSQCSRKNYQKYLNTIINKNDKLSLVADMGHCFSALKLVRTFVDNSVRGVFWANSGKLLDENNIVFAQTNFQHEKVFAKSNIDVFTKNWDLVEFLMSSPEHSVKEIDEYGKPVYDENPSAFECKRSALYPDIVNSALAFSDNALQLFGGYDLCLDFSTLVSWLNCFIDNPQKEDIKCWADICFFRLVNNTVPSQSLSLSFPIRDYLFHPARTKERIKKLFWKTDFQKWYMNHWGVYKDKTPNYKIKKFWGFVLSSQCITHEKNVKTKFGGLIRVVKCPYRKSFYFLGIKIFEKDKHLTIHNIQKLLDTVKREVIDKVSVKVQRSLTVAFLHQKTFGEFRNKYEGRTMALVGAGPTVKFLEPLKNTVYVGLNRAFLRKDIHFDYLFSIDKAGLDTGKEQFYEQFLNYNCIKFMGDQNMGMDFQIPQDIIYKDDCVRRYKTTARFLPNSFALDIDTEALANSSSCSLQAMQFILFTNPKKVYVYGIDCSCASGQHFTGGAVNNAARGENARIIDAQHIADWKRLKNFINIYYPETEIYIVNPIGLKGIFHDVYTKSYLAKHPEIDETQVEILTEEVSYEH